jgi:hypothetical protein
LQKESTQLLEQTTFVYNVCSKLQVLLQFINQWPSNPSSFIENMHTKKISIVLVELLGVVKEASMCVQLNTVSSSDLLSLLKTVDEEYAFFQ